MKRILLFVIVCVILCPLWSSADDGNEEEKKEDENPPAPTNIKIGELNQNNRLIQWNRAKISAQNQSNPLQSRGDRIIQAKQMWKFIHIKFWQSRASKCNELRDV